MTPNENYSSPTIDGLLTQFRVVKPLQPWTFEPMLSEITDSLPKINRYNGHTKFPYSVAQHCLLCTEILEKHEFYRNQPHALLYMLLHDCAEAYLQDLVRPLKQYMHDSYFHSEKAITDKLLATFLNYEEMEAINEFAFQEYVKEIDTRLAVTEMLQLMGNFPFSLPNYEPYDFTIKEMHWKEVTETYVRKLTGLLVALLTSKLTGEKE